MIKNLLGSILIFCLFITKSFGSEAGMPQLNPEFWISQIFWLILIFFFLYIFLSKIILPKIGENLESRKSQIINNLDQAQKNKENSEKNIREYEKTLDEAKNQARKILNTERKKINKEIKEKQNQLNLEIQKETNKIEDEIQLLKKNSINDINKIAIETSSMIIKDLVDVNLNNSSISAIVNDVSKRKIKNYL